jgi:hypothetical protein
MNTSSILYMAVAKTENNAEVPDQRIFPENKQTNKQSNKQTRNVYTRQVL